ncbi:MAG TPA: alpha-L-fucosidase [Candidatus Kryptonia bacterium]
MKRTALVVLFLMLASGLSFGQDYLQKYYPETDTLVLGNLHKWQGNKFGLLMHWGTYSQWGVVESWSICSEDEGWEKRRDSNYTEYKTRYQDLIKTFNPVKFNPAKWAEAAEDAGMKYVVFTTKHHDGFCMFDTKTTDYKITGPDCPFHTDPRANIAKEIFDAFRKDGFMIGAYFSKPDWHSPYYWWPNFATPDRNPNYSIRRHPDRWQKFVEYTQAQINELMSDYGRIDILWLDGGWVRQKTDAEITEEKLSADYPVFPQSQDIDMPLIVRDAREKQPGLIVVDRAVPGPDQDYLTPENTVPDHPLPYPWETCMPMATSWSYVPHDKYKSVGELIHLLVDIVSKGGNFLVNIGPGPDGEFDPVAYERLKGIGEWMKINGEAIYKTHPVAPYKDGKVCLTQLDDGTTYAIYLADKDETNPPPKIWMSEFCPESGAKVTLLGSNSELIWEKVGNGFEVEVPSSYQQHPPCKYAWVLKISGQHK